MEKLGGKALRRFVALSGGGDTICVQNSRKEVAGKVGANVLNDSLARVCGGVKVAGTGCRKRRPPGSESC